MSINDLEIKLDAAKKAIAIAGFKSDALLRIALVDRVTLQAPKILEQEALLINRQHKQLAFLGDRLLDAVLADYLLATHPELTNKKLDAWRQKITKRKALAAFAIKLGLPDFCSSASRPTRKPPEEEPAVYGEMFEALVAVIYLDGDRNFQSIANWLRDRFIQEAVNYCLL